MTNIQVPGDEKALQNATNADNGDFALHDESDGNPQGVYWYDATNGQWVKASSNDLASSVTITA